MLEDKSGVSCSKEILRWWQTEEEPEWPPWKKQTNNQTKKNHCTYKYEILHDQEQEEQWIVQHSTNQPSTSRRHIQKSVEAKLWWWTSICFGIEMEAEASTDLIYYKWKYMKHKYHETYCKWGIVKHDSLNTAVIWESCRQQWQ